MGGGGVRVGGECSVQFKILISSAAGGRREEEHKGEDERNARNSANYSGIFLFSD